MGDEMCIVFCELSVSCCRWRMRTFVEIVLEVVVSVYAVEKKASSFLKGRARAIIIPRPSTTL